MSRTTARETVVQLIFAATSAKLSADETIENFFEEEHFSTLNGENECFASAPGKKDMEYIKTLSNLILSNLSEIDGFIERYSSGWKLERISKTALAVMRCAICEMLYTDIPAGAAINEAVELAKGYEPDETVSFINGVLGSFCRNELAAKTED